MPVPSPTTKLVDIDGKSTNVTTWTSDGTRNRLVVVFHGFLAHSKYPTVRYAAELLASTPGTTVIAADMPGHGQSPGTVGYLASASSVVQWAASVVKYAVNTVSSTTTTTVFLLGSSLGGALALLTAEQCSSDVVVDGVILLAPMMGLKNVSDIERKLLYGLTCVLPNRWALIPSSATDAAKQYRDPEKRKECEEMAADTKHLCLGSAYTCIELVQRVQTISADKVPIWMGIADEDVVVDSEASVSWFQENGKNSDSELKRYPALHGLLCEPSPLVDTIQKDMITWIEGRSSSGSS